ncbi:hypothetical protein EZ449_09155 [Pedobacter frigidisoli]|uniref:Uncharacterized protein n=1 Tax=Pedobacter frigidisoli TaxID=2530455 RepID=A0A4R0P181_9SPHI|nr:hypothetical protein [Pedobacter frigidisoli]TCD10504.1 hypothetical protein EZ449_09155 [Pedobacter frigidisoli]
METRFYSINSNQYTVKKNNLFRVFVILLFVVICILFYINGSKIKGSNIPYYAFTFLPIVFSLVEIGKTVKINIADKTVKETLFGLTLKKSTFCKFSRFIIIKKKINFINSGTDVTIEFKNLRQISTIKFNHFNKAEQAEEFISETKALLTL